MKQLSLSHLRFLEPGDQVLAGSRAKPRLIHPYYTVALAPPIAFTLGTGMRHGAGFFHAAVAACGMLGRRGILLTRHAPGQVADNAPQKVSSLFWSGSFPAPSCS